MADTLASIGAPAAATPMYEVPSARQSPSSGLGGFFVNAFRDLKDMATGFGQLATVGLHDLAHGVAEAVTLGHASGGFLVDDIVKALPAAMAHDYAQRYGSIGKFGEGLYEHPLQFLSDALMVAGGVSAIAGQVGKVGGVAAEIGSVAEGATKADEVSMAARAVMAIRGTAKTYTDPLSGMTKVLDPVTNPLKRLIVNKMIFKTGAVATDAQAVAAGGMAVDAALGGTDAIETALKLADRTEAVLTSPVPVMRTWAAKALSHRFADTIFGNTLGKVRVDEAKVARVAAEVNSHLPEGVSPEQFVDATTGLDIRAFKDDVPLPLPGSGDRATEKFLAPQVAHAPNTEQEFAGWGESTLPNTSATRQQTLGDIVPAIRDALPTAKVTLGDAKTVASRDRDAALRMVETPGGGNLPKATGDEAYKSAQYLEGALASKKDDLKTAQKAAKDTPSPEADAIVQKVQGELAGVQRRLDDMTDGWHSRTKGGGELPAKLKRTAPQDEIYAVHQAVTVTPSNAVDRTMSGLGETLATPGNRFQAEFDAALAESAKAAEPVGKGVFRKTPKTGTLEDLGGGVYKMPNTEGEGTKIVGEDTYYMVDAKGKVVSMRRVAGNGSVGAWTADGLTGNGYGTSLGVAHWRDKGITTPEKIVAELKKQTFSNAGAALNHSMIDEILAGGKVEPRNLREAIFAKLGISVSKDGTLHDLKTGSLVSDATPSRMLEDDAIRMRIIHDDVVNDPERMNSAIEAATGAKRQVLKDAVLSPDGGGERYARWVYHTADKVPFEIQLFDSQLAADAYDATSGFRTAVKQAQTMAEVYTRAGKVVPEFLAHKIASAQAMSQSLWDHVVDEMRLQHFGGVKPGELRRESGKMKLAVYQHITNPEVERGALDVEQALDASFMPHRVAEGTATWDDGIHGYVGGPDSLTQWDNLKKQGLPAPMYYPMMDPERTPRLVDFISKTEQSKRKLAAGLKDVHLRHRSGQLLHESLTGTGPGYSKDLVRVMRVRAARAARMSETLNLIEHITAQAGMVLQKGDQVPDGMVAWAPQVVRALFAQKHGIEDSVLEAMQKGGSIQGAIESAVGRSAQANGRMVGNLADTTLIAIPEVVYERIMDHVKGYLGDLPALREWRKATGIYKSAVLSYSPRWVLNNALTNSIFVGLQNPRGLGTVAHLALSKKFREKAWEAVGEEAKGHIVSTAFASRAGEALGADQEVAGSIAQHVVSKIEGARSAKAATYVPRKFGSLIRDANEKVEDVFRLASYLSAADRAGIKKGTIGLLTSWWNSKARLENAFRQGLDEESAGKLWDEVNHYMNDYNRASPMERQIARPFIMPFEAFYRHALKTVLSTPWEHPAKARIAEFVKEAMDSRAEQLGVGGPVPPWLEGAIPFPGVDPGKARFLSSAGANPFNTIFTQPAELVNPAWKILFERATGRNTRTGKPFTAANTFTPFGSDQRFVMQDGVPVPYEQVTPPLWQQMLSQIPLVSTVKDLAYGGSAYDTTGFLDMMRGKGLRIDPNTGDPLYPKSRLDSLSQFLGYSQFDYGLQDYQTQLAKEQTLAMEQYLKSTGQSPAPPTSGPTPIPGG